MLTVGIIHLTPPFSLQHSSTVQKVFNSGSKGRGVASAVLFCDASLKVTSWDPNTQFC